MIDATGTTPTASAQPAPPPSSATRSCAAAGRAGVVPQQRRPDHLAGAVEADHAVLLTAHRDGGDVVQPAGRAGRVLQGGPPRGRVDLGAVRVRRATLAHQRSGGRVPDDDLARLGGRVDPGDERSGSRHPQRAPRTCSTASWSSRPKPYPAAAMASASNASYAEVSASSAS